MLKLVGRQALHALHLRNDFVAPALNAEPVDIVSTQKRRKILPRLAQIHTLRAQFVAVEHDFRLWLIELYVHIGKKEHAGGHSLLHDLTCQFSYLLRLCRRGDHQIDWEISATRQWRRSQRNYPNACDLCKRASRRSQ